MESVGRPGGAGFPANPLHWTETQLAAFLQSRGLPRSTAQAFEDHLVNGLVAVDLSPEDLASMGICDDFQQRRLLLELRQLFASGDDAGLLSKLDAFLPEVQPQAPTALLKWPESSKAKPVSPYLQGLGGRARRPKPKMAAPEGRPENPAQQTAAAVASLAGGLHASDVQAAILAALPGALEAYLVPKLHPSVPSAPKHAPQKPSPRPGARRPATGQARWHATQGWDPCRPAIICEARPFEESPASEAGCNDEVAKEHGDTIQGMEDEARALVPLLQAMQLPDDKSKQGSTPRARVEELEAQLQVLRDSLQDATRERADLNRKLQASTDRCQALERQLGSNQRQCDELLKELQEANEHREQQRATMESLRADLLAQQQQLQQQQQQQSGQQLNQQQLQMRETCSQCSLLAFTPSADTQTERPDACSSPGPPPALPPRLRRDEADRSVGSSSGAEVVVGNLTASFEAVWQQDPGSLVGGRSSSQRELDHICDEFRLQVRDIVAARLPRPQSSASAGASARRSSATLDEMVTSEQASSERFPILIAASQEASFPELPSQFVDATVAGLAESVLAAEEQVSDNNS
eukprot:TRINITY_DN23845_c0_g2_i1.p1 TRINITY_DN23845_c0_g2~~TRINITY_DN23845_c0_g2_i1.p1  ORF type:complete len:582 (-),score=133.37 TRINITY_DN23845_c0_g2_i1:62-1807(-)